MRFAEVEAPLFAEESHDRPDITHVLMPWMRYACGRGVVEDGGHFIVGPSQRWSQVDCPDCLAFGYDELAAECVRSQRDQAGAA